MARLIIQSLVTGRFLVPNPEDGQPMWTGSLRAVGGGLLTDVEQAVQLFEDWCDAEDGAVLVDLDRLGTVNDYLPGGM